jgi:hypothetical protein
VASAHPGRPDWSLAALRTFLRRALLVPLLGSALVLCGCTTMAYAPAPADFPDLRVERHPLAHAVFRDKCASAIGTGHHVATGIVALLGGAALPAAVLAAVAGPAVDACAEVDFAAGVCNIYYSSEFPPGDIIMRHERERRCRGYDNIGDRTIRDAWAWYKHQRELALWREFEFQKAARGW